MKHEGNASVKIIPQTYRQGDKTVKMYSAEIVRDRRKKFYVNISRRWRLWLERNTGALMFTDSRIYPKGAVDRFGVPANDLTLRRK